MPIPPLWPFHRKQLKCRAPVKRPLSFSPAVPSVTLPVGAGFLVHWDSNTGGSLSVTHVEEPDRVLWSTIPGECFLSAAAGEERIRDKRGSINVADRIIYGCGNQTVERIYAAGRGDRRGVVVSGTLFSEPQCAAQSVKAAPTGTAGLHGDTPLRTTCTGGCVIRVPYRLTFSEKRAHHLGFEVSVGAATFTAPPLSSSPSTASEHAPEGLVGEDDALLGQLRKAEYVADWLAGSQLNSGGIQDEACDVTVPESSDESSALQQESDGEIPALSMLSRSEPSTGDLASSYSQWSAASGASDALSAKWWSLATSATDEGVDESRQVRVRGCEGGRRLPLAINRVQLTYTSDPEERFFGFGEQFSHFDLKGKKVPILVQEQGIGRGDQPITFLANLASPGSGGSDTSSYAAVPHYITSRMRSLYLESYEYALFDLTEPHAVQIRVHASSVHGRILHGTTPAQLIERYTAAIGRMRPLPRWLTRGAVLGLQGGTARVREILAQLRAHRVPLAGVWLQDWVGQRRTAIGWQLWWNWQLDREHYPDWEALVDEIRAGGARVMGYVNPFLAKVGGPQAAHYGRDLFQEASARGLLVRARGGGPYMVENTSFSAGLLDLTNADARHWLKDVMKTEMVRLGIDGWMADFGESLPFDSVLHSGENPAVVHNRYPEMWARLNQEVADEVEAERSYARLSLPRTLSPAHSAALKKLLLPDPEQPTGTPLRGSPRQSLSSFCGAASCSSSWASLPSDDCGDQLEEGGADWSPSQSPGAFALLDTPDAEETVEPFLLEDVFEAESPQVPAFVAQSSQSSEAGLLESVNDVRVGITSTKHIEKESRLSESDGELVADEEGFETETESPLPATDGELDADALERDNEELDAARPVFFMRAGYRGSPGAASLFWLGDQMTSWQRHDGIKSAVTGLLSGGLSGFSLNHGDIGGYCSVALPGPLGVTRSEELLLRWMELAAFTTVFRTHEGNLPHAGAQAYSNARALAHFGRMARVYAAWDFYRQDLMQEAASTGLPVVRHLFLHYPHDPTVHRLTYEQFLVGDQILFAPVLDPGTARVKVYLPGGEVWQHVWSGKRHQSTLSEGKGDFVEVEAPMGFPAAFVREGSRVGRRFCDNLREQGLLQ